MKKFSQIFFRAAIIASLVLSPLVPARASLGIPQIVFDPILKIIDGFKLSAQYLGNMSLGLPGSGAGVKASNIAAKKPCSVAKKAYEVSNTADNFAGAEIIAGSAGQLAKLQGKIVSLTIVRNCYEAVMYGEEVAGTLAATSGIQALIANSGNEQILQSAIDTMDLRLDRLKELRTNAEKELWKGVALRILYMGSQKIATSMVNKLIAKYKIGDYIGYTNAVATQVYAVDYVNKNVKNNQDQAILRSVMNNQGTQSAVLPMVRVKTKEALGFDATQLDFTSPNFTTQLAKLGAPEADPAFMQLVYNSQAKSAQMQAQEVAKQEINNGSGMMPVRNCRDVVAQQQGFDNQNLQLSLLVRTNEDILNKLLEKQKLNPQSVSASDIQLATANLAASQKKLSALPETNRSFVKACDDIANPGKAVGDFTTAYLNSHLIAANTPNNQNLPFFASFIEGTAKNFVGSLIESGNPNMQYLTGTGLQAGNLTANQYASTMDNSQSLKRASDNSQNNTAIFYASSSPVPGSKIVVWDVSPIAGAAAIQITGTGNYSYSASSTAGSVITPKIPAPAYLTLKVLDASGVVINSLYYSVPAEAAPAAVSASSTPSGTVGQAVGDINRDLNGNGTIPPNPDVTVPTPSGLTDSQWQVCQQQGFNANECRSQFITGSVHGAYTQKSNFHPRGEPVPILIR